MELIDIFDENNNPTGVIKEKYEAHEEELFHRTAHVWIINNKNELLLQKRSAKKKSEPNCWDISGAGHISAGESVIEGALRELSEELGVITEETNLEYIATIKSTKNPKNLEFQYVYLLRTEMKIEEYVFKDEEVSEVKYVYYKNLEKMVENRTPGLLMHDEEYKKLFEYIRNYVDKVVYKYQDAPERTVGGNMKIKDLFAGKDMPMDFVIGKLNGFHGTFINTKNTKYYFIIDGSATVTIDGVESNVEKGDFVLIPVNAKHSIEGNVEFAVMCTPSFDINSEKII